MKTARRWSRALVAAAVALAVVPGPASASGPPVKGLSKIGSKVLLMVLQRPRAVTLAAPEGARARVGEASGSGTLLLGPEPMEVRAEATGRDLVLSGGLPGPRHCRELSVGPALLRLAEAGSTPREYFGRLTASVRGGSLRLMLELPASRLAAGVTGTELAPGSPPEAAKAQGVACLSYILANLGRHRLEGADFCDTTHCQHYLGEDPAGARSARGAGARSGAARPRPAEPGEVLLWNGKPLAAFYTADCGGELAHPSELWGGGPGPFRVGPDPWCLRAVDRAPEADWRVELPAATFARAIAAAAGRPRTGAPGTIGVEYAGGSGGSIVSYFSLGEGGQRLRARFEMVNRALRALVGRWAIPGRRLSMTVRGGVVCLQGRGRGHLAGLCQRGAAQMAREGKRCAEILAFYYPGARPVPWASVLR